MVLLGFGVGFFLVVYMYLLQIVTSSCHRIDIRDLRMKLHSFPKTENIWPSFGGYHWRGREVSTKAVLICTARRLTTRPSFFPGFLSGGLHAITGPDHLAAILPASVGSSFVGGIKIGAAWGLGHGITASMFGALAFFLKGTVVNNMGFLDRLSHLAESVVGVSLVAIGLIGVKESVCSDENDSLDPNVIDGSIRHSPQPGILSLSRFWYIVHDICSDFIINIYFHLHRVDANKLLKSIFANGILHGLSLDGAPSIAPALAMSSWKSALSFLLAYCVGTMAIMSFAAGIVGEGSIRLGEAIDNPNFPKKMSFISSLIAILIGIYYILS